MDYNNLATSIRDLTLSLTNWSSTVCIPTSDSNKFLDISSAAKGNSSSTPVGAGNIMDHFTGSILQYIMGRTLGKTWKACCVEQVVSVDAKFQPGIPGMQLHPKRNLTPLLLRSSVPMNQGPPLLLPQVQLVRTMWLEKTWSGIRLREGKVSGTTIYTTHVYITQIYTYTIWTSIICIFHRYPWHG